MRAIVMAVICAASAASIGAAPPKRAAPAGKPIAPRVVELPVFSFLGQDTETPSTMTTLNAAACTSSGDVTDCTDYRNPEIAGRPMRFMWMKFNRGRLYSVYASFGEHAYSDVAAAFAAKYGPPAAVEVRKWQSKGGGSFDNSVSIWKFKGGNLELESKGLDVSSGSFSFTSLTNAPPAERPKVDF